MYGFRTDDFRKVARFLGVIHKQTANNSMCFLSLITKHQPAYLAKRYLSIFPCNLSSLKTKRSWRRSTREDVWSMHRRQGRLLFLSPDAGSWLDIVPARSGRQVEQNCSAFTSLCSFQAWFLYLLFTSMARRWEWPWGFRLQLSLAKTMRTLSGWQRKSETKWRRKYAPIVTRNEIKRLSFSFPARPLGPVTDRVSLADDPCLNFFL